MSAQDIDVPVSGVEQAAPEDRRVLRAALRWTAAVLVFAAAGAATAYGLTRADRTDLPGLATRNDGRWAYPKLAKPAVPAGAPVGTDPVNRELRHYEALAELLLPAPAGARPDAAFKADKAAGVTPEAFLDEYAPDVREAMKQSLEWDGLRQIAGRGWIMPDGTRTHIYLLRFHSSGFVDTFGGCNATTRLGGVPAVELDPAWSAVKLKQPPTGTPQGIAGSGTPSSSTISLYQEAKPVGGVARTRLGCLQTGDVQAVIVQAREGGAAVTAFHQTAILQSQLLG
ncbi:hypothetical protein AB0953_06130 [Streptomyces sp. NPDC046866]|uniref:hypothetical protein n=1 Tax=Streptomyces sp. NPDC046866 TaxID=3154921 RepID=UPI00345652BB